MSLRTIRVSHFVHYVIVLTHTVLYVQHNEAIISDLKLLYKEIFKAINIIVLLYVVSRFR